jgi:hypothetical protein
MSKDRVEENDSSAFAIISISIYFSFFFPGEKIDWLKSQHGIHYLDRKRRDTLDFAATKHVNGKGLDRSK